MRVTSTLLNCRLQFGQRHLTQYDQHPSLPLNGVTWSRLKLFYSLQHTTTGDTDLTGTFCLPVASVNSRLFMSRTHTLYVVSGYRNGMAALKNLAKAESC